MSGPGGPAPRQLVLASANPDKVKEIVAVLSAALPVELLPRPAGVPDVVEDADTLVGNARLKARALVAATGTAAVADDTGLEVDALGGAPGVYSARYAGEDATYADNVAKLLRELAARGRGRGDRRARFKTVALVAFPDGSEVWAEGVLPGTIADRAPGRQRLRLRPGVRARRRRRADLRRDAAGGEGRRVPPRPRLPGAGRGAGRGAVAGRDVTSPGRQGSSLWNHIDPRRTR